MEESEIETESETVEWKAAGTAVKQRGRVEEKSMRKQSTISLGR